MSFVRLKKVKGNYYAYRVETHREGDRVYQKVREYLGPATAKQIKKAKERKRRKGRKR